MEIILEDHLINYPSILTLNYLRTNKSPFFLSEGYIETYRPLFLYEVRTRKKNTSFMIISNERNELLNAFIAFKKFTCVTGKQFNNTLIFCIDIIFLF